MKKKFIPIFTALILIFSACGKDSDTALPAETENTVHETAEAFAEKITEARTEVVTEIPSVTSETKEKRTFTQVTSQPYGESVSEQNILMFIIYENHAWSFCQYVDVLDADGRCYRFSCEDVEESFKPWKDENWYARLEEIAAEEECLGNIIDPDLDTVGEFKDRFSEYSDCPYRVYDNSSCDWGTSTLYGIFLDENSVPRYTEFCSYGDQVNCIDDSDVIDFVNSIDITAEKLRTYEKKDGTIFFHTDSEFDY